MIKKRLHSGRLVDVTDLQPDDIDITDIIHSLDKICRYDGHVPRHYSVLEHSLHVLDAVPGQCSPHIKLLALMHDATECYIGDMQSGIKDNLLIYLPFEPEPVPVREFEYVLMRKIAEKFGINSTMLAWNIVSGIDKEITAIEMDHFFHGKKDGRFGKYQYVKVKFFKRFYNLRQEVRNERG